MAVWNVKINFPYRHKWLFVVRERPFGGVAGGLLWCDMCPFAMQKGTYCIMKGYLLHRDMA